jgi:hypothetical protein
MKTGQIDARAVVTKSCARIADVSKKKPARRAALATPPTFDQVVSALLRVKPVDVAKLEAKEAKKAKGRKR